tara:strand:+ start:3850 stop:4596 length:747 start_codon:yes stop_codon:yes gene_type:complete
MKTKYKIKNIHCIVQARLSSTRLPAKIFLTGCRKTLIEHLIERLKFSKKISEIIIATPKTSKHNFFSTFFDKKKYNIFFGSENNVLERYYNCAKKFKSDIIIRVTSDCPLMDHRIIDEMINYFHKNECDYLSNVRPRNYPLGLDVEIFSFSALKKTYLNANKIFDKEHVTPFMWKNKDKFKILNFKSKKIKNKMNNTFRLTLDYLEDYILIFNVFNKLYKQDKNFSLNKILNFLKKNKKISRINKLFI